MFRFVIKFLRDDDDQPWVLPGGVVGWSVATSRDLPLCRTLRLPLKYLTPTISTPPPPISHTTISLGRMEIKNGCGKWFCKAPKKVWTAILDFIRRQEYFGGIIAMMPPKYPLPTLWERACQRLWCASDWSYCLGIAASNLVSHTMQMARTSGGDTKSLAVSARFFILEQSN